MKEYRFKVLKNGDFLCSFDEEEMIIGSPDGKYRIHRVYDINTNPSFSKKFETVSVYTPSDLPDGFFFIKFGGEYRGYKVSDVNSGLPVIDEKFCIVIKNGIGKIEAYDTETEITITIPAKDD